MILENISYLFDLNQKDEVYGKPNLLKKFTTRSNPTGLGELCYDKTSTLVVLPGKHETTVQVHSFNSSKEAELEEEFDIEDEITMLSANISGGVFAYTDSKGINIKLRSIIDGEIIQTY